MERYHNLIIIGTSHISRESAEEIGKEFISFAPEIVAIELDKERLRALFSGNRGKVSFRDIRRVGIKGFMFAVIGSWASRKLGKIVGVEPGVEMKTAVELCRKNKARLELIDRPIEITLRRFSASLSWKERYNLLHDIVSSVIFRKKDPLLDFDLRKVPGKSIIREMMGRMKKRYPNIYSVLIEERNYFMARKLKRLMAFNKDKNIIAVMGAGHEEDVLRILKENEGIALQLAPQ